jgi:hypothetical protein
MKNTIYHPKCKELSGTIEKLKLTKEQLDEGFGEYEVIDSMGWEEWYDTYDEAKTELLESLENHFNGSTQKGIDDDNRYDRAEHFACGGE